MGNLAMFEGARFFGERCQRAVIQIGALQLSWLLDDIKKCGDAAHGIERAMWRETYLRLIAPSMMRERDPFAHWHGARLPEAKKK